MKKILAVFLCLCASFCSAQIEHSGITIPGDSAVQMGRKTGLKPIIPVETAFPDGIIFSSYVTAYSANSAGVPASMEDRSPAGNDLTQATESNKPILGTYGGYPVMRNHVLPTILPRWMEGRLVGIGSTTWTIAVTYISQHLATGTGNSIPWAYGNKALTTNTVEGLEFGFSAGSTYNRVDLFHGSSNDFTLSSTGIMGYQTGPNTLIYTVSDGVLQRATFNDETVATGTTGSPNPNLGGDYFGLGAIPQSWVGTVYTHEMDFLSFHVWNRALTAEEHTALRAKLIEVKEYLKAGGQL